MFALRQVVGEGSSRGRWGLGGLESMVAWSSWGR